MKIGEFKFRVWNIEDARFLNKVEKEGDYLIDFNGKLRIANWSEGNGDNSSDSVFEPIHDQFNYIIQQYTGIKDKNGKEIYEGDFLEGFEDPVSFENGSFSVGISYDQTNFLLSELVSSEIEVIGNIFESTRKQ